MEEELSTKEAISLLPHMAASISGVLHIEVRRSTRNEDNSPKRHWVTSRLVFWCSPPFVVSPGQITLPAYQTGHQTLVTVITAVHQRSPPAPVAAVQLCGSYLTQELQVPHAGRGVTVKRGEEVLNPRSLVLTGPERESNPEELFLTETVVLV